MTSAQPLHGPDVALGDLVEQVGEFIAGRLRGGAPLGRTATPADLAPLLAGTITPGGLGPGEAWRRFTEGIVPNTVSLDSERFLAFIPVSPSAAAVWMDAAVSAVSFSAESWLEAAGAVAGENQVLAWLGDLAGLPPGSGGAFCSGGSVGNLSALAVAREQRRGRRVVAVADTVHASVRNALHLLDLCELVVPTAGDGRMTAGALRAAISGRDDVGIVVASGGSTNAGVVDDLDGVAGVAAELGAWLHVDAAYGGAALLVEEARPLFAGIGRADSVIVDPHKWLFAPSGSCALLYREPALAAAVHTQHGPYLDSIHAEGAWNPADYAFQLTRRASGLPLWFALAVHGVEAHAAAVAHGIALARSAAATLERAEDVEVLNAPPDLGVVLFRRRGWDRQRWQRWAAELLAAEIAFVAPTTWKGEPVGRLVFMHPRTHPSVVEEIAATL